MLQAFYERAAMLSVASARYSEVNAVVVAGVPVTELVRCFTSGKREK